jgi:PTH1 family peptidyl-tRNA hydrolase
MISMKVIVGLGNPEEKFDGTRHNVGFHIVNRLAARLGITLNQSPKLFSMIGKNNDWLLIKPQTYMNESGKAVQAVLAFYKLTPQDLVVIHDDLDIELGKWKQQVGTGPKEHNGLLSIYEQLGTEDFTHLRIGIDSREGDRTLAGKDYVLHPFTLEESRKLGEVTGKVIESLLT